MSREQIQKLVELAAQPARHGMWSRFCKEYGLSRDEVFHWRKKLGLPLRHAGARPAAHS